jgi:transcriptional regulator with XRE-family HTH domain
VNTESSVPNEEMREKEYRHGLVSAQFDIDIPLQIRALRKQRNWTQPELAALAEMKQPRISAMEKPGGANFTLETLRRLAKAFDVALIVRFAPFGELADWSKEFNPDSFDVPSFEDDPAFKESPVVAERASRSLLDLLMAGHPELAVTLSGAGDSVKELQEASLAAVAYCKQIGTHLSDSMNAFNAAISSITSNIPLVANQVEAQVMETANPGVITAYALGPKVTSITSGKAGRYSRRGRGLNTRALRRRCA